MEVVGSVEIRTTHLGSYKNTTRIDEAHMASSAAYMYSEFFHISYC